MYQLDEKLMADNRAIISIAQDIDHAEPNLKPGMQVFNATTKDTYVVSSQQKYNRLIHEDILTKKIPYDLNFAGTIIVDKDLIVKGNLTNLESQDLVIKDNIIELNKDETGSGITKIQSGIEINRGTKERARMLFSEATDRIDTSGFLLNIGDNTLMTVFQDGDLKTTKDLYTCTANVRDDLLVGRDFTLTRNALIKGTLTVNQAASLKSTLAVTGASTFTGAGAFKSTLAVTGATTLSNTLSVAENASLLKELSVTGNTYLKANLGVTNNATIGGTLGVTGATTLASTLEVTGATTLNNTLTVAENATFSKTISVAGNASFTGTASITGNLITNSITNSGLIKTSTLQTISNTSVGGTLTTTGIATFNNDVNMNKNVAITGNSALTGTLNVTGKTTVADLSVGGAAEVVGTFNAKSAATFEQSITVNLPATFKDIATVEKSASIYEDLNVGGAGGFGHVNVSQNLTVGGATTVNTLSVSGVSYFTGLLTAKNMNIESITMKTSRNVIQWEDDTVTHSIYGANNSSDRYHTLYDFSTNDYNLTFKTMPTTGKEKGFVFVSGTTPLFHINQKNVRSQNDIYVKRNTTWSPLLARADQHKLNHSKDGHDFLSPADIGAVKNAKDTPEIITDNEANRPQAGIVGRLFFAKDTKRIWQDLGNIWQIIGGQETMPWESVTNKPATFTPPIASSTVLGGVKIGSNIVLDTDGTIHVPKQMIEYTVYVQEFKTTEGQKVFTLNKSFLIGRNHVSPYLFGRRIPTSAFKETSDNTIEFLEGLPANAILEFYVLLIPSDLSFVMKIEEFNLTANQTILKLTQGRYTIGANKLKIFLNGALMPRSSFRETSSTTVELLECPGVGNHILVEYMYDPLAN